MATISKVTILGYYGLLSLLAFSSVLPIRAQAPAGLPRDVRVDRSKDPSVSLSYDPSVYVAPAPANSSTVSRSTARVESRQRQTGERDAAAPITTKRVPMPPMAVLSPTFAPPGVLPLTAFGPTAPYPNFRSAELAPYPPSASPSSHTLHLPGLLERQTAPRRGMHTPLRSNARSRVGNPSSYGTAH